MPRPRSVVNPPRRKDVVNIVWTLARMTGHHREHLGVFSTDLKAIDQANQIIAKEAGLARLRAPMWCPRPEGGKELIYGRDARSWRFVVNAEPVDSASA